jgi:short-subunit dehydrogenase
MTRTICITGASSGLGRALAVEYSRPGTTLGLLGRDGSRLDETAELCRRLGAEVRTAQIDVRDEAALETWLTAFDNERPVDVLIANAGVSSGAGRDGAIEPMATSIRLLDVNLRGAVATTVALAERMRTRRRGSIVLVASIAGLLPQPTLPTYGASKAGLVSYGLALSSALKRYGVRVTVVCPGYVDTPMARRHGAYKPFQWTAEQAARRIRSGVERGQRMIVFPWILATGARILALAPSPLFDLIVRAFAADVQPDAEGEVERRQAPMRNDSGPS